MVIVSDDGTDILDKRSLNETEWKDDSFCECLKCGYLSVFGRFRF